MSLDTLAKIVSELAIVSDEHREVLSVREERTRYALIDPLLLALGWNIHDPSSVIPEFMDENTGNKRADYALFSGGEVPRILVEAKRLGTPLSVGIDQSLGHCLNIGVQYFAVTDGRHWVVYEPHKLGNLEKNKVLASDLADESPRTTMKAIWLWRGNFATDSAQPIQDLPSDELR